LKRYETTVIVNPQAEESQIDEQVKSVARLITENGGKIIREERMGTRRLAYPIEGLNQGYYAVFCYESEPPVLPIIDRHLKLGEAYLRHLTIIFDGDPEVVYGDKARRSFDMEQEREREPQDDDRRPFRSDHRGGGGGGRGGYNRGSRSRNEGF